MSGKEKQDMSRKQFSTSFSKVRITGYEMNEAKGGFYYPIYLTLAKANMVSKSKLVNLWRENPTKH